MFVLMHLFYTLCCYIIKIKYYVFWLVAGFPYELIGIWKIRTLWNSSVESSCFMFRVCNNCAYLAYLPTHSTRMWCIYVYIRYQGLKYMQVHNRSRYGRRTYVYPSRSWMPTTTVGIASKVVQEISRSLPYYYYYYWNCCSASNPYLSYRWMHAPTV